MKRREHMYAQATVGYPNNVWNNGYSYSNMNFQNNVTNVYGGNGGTSIFGSSSNVVTHVPFDSIMTAPFGAQQMSYSAAYVPQQQTTDYTGKMIDMLMQMCMMVFQKKLNGTTSDNPKVVIEDEEEMTALEAAKVLKKNFILYEHINDAKKGNLDGKASWEEVMKYAQTTDNEEFIRAFEYFDTHPDEFHVMENLGSTSKSSDFVFTDKELQEFIDRLS